jgi:hypothetical protein
VAAVAVNAGGRRETLGMLTLVADPESLFVKEGGVLEGTRERGFELIPFEDHFVFRCTYESKFRSRKDRGEKTDQLH